MHQNDFKNHVSDKLFSSEKIAFIKKPSRGCGSTTLLLDYIYDRMVYENDYNILVVSRDSHHERYLSDRIKSNKLWREELVIQPTMIFNPELNNRIFFLLYKNLESRISGMKLNEIVLQDANPDIMSDRMTLELVSAIQARNGRILVEENVQH